MKFDAFSFGIIATTFVATSLQGAPAKKTGETKSKWHCQEKPEQAVGCGANGSCATPKKIEAKDAKECASKNGEWTQSTETKK